MRRGWLRFGTRTGNSGSDRLASRNAAGPHPGSGRGAGPGNVNHQTVEVHLWSTATTVELEAKDLIQLQGSWTPRRRRVQYGHGELWVVADHVFCHDLVGCLHGGGAVDRNSLFRELLRGHIPQPLHGGLKTRCRSFDLTPYHPIVISGPATPHS